MRGYSQRQGKNIYGRVGVLTMAKQIKSKYTDVPVKDISNGVILLDNNQRVTGVKIMPRNIFILEQSMQDAIIMNLKNVYNAIDYEFWIVVADRPVDINLYLSQLQLLYNKVGDNKKRKLILEDINKANMFMNNNVVDTEYFLLFKHKDSDVIQRTETTLKMANVTGQSAQEVSDQMTAIWNNFYDGSKSIEYYSDVITALGAATASSSDEIAQGLEKFAAVAETVGLSYEYATAALAIITSETRQSADVVGTALKTLFARIQDLELGETLDDGTTLGSYAEALQKVGIDIKDQTGELKEMDTILNEMGAKWQTLSKDQQTALAQNVAGVRQYTQLVALMDNWDKMKQNVNVAHDSAGTLQEQQKIYEESWQAASKRVRAAMESVFQNLIDDKAFISILNIFEDI